MLQTLCRLFRNRAQCHLFQARPGYKRPNRIADTVSGSLRTDIDSREYDCRLDPLHRSHPERFDMTIAVQNICDRIKDYVHCPEFTLSAGSIELGRVARVCHCHNKA
jgi:hypothetical protein